MLQMSATNRTIERAMHIALIAFAVFPTLGNALAVLTDSSRRIWQLGVLLGSLGTILYGLRAGGLLRVYVASQMKSPAMLAGAGTILLILATIGPRLAAGTMLDSYGVIAPLISAVWIFLGAFQLLRLRHAKTHVRPPLAVAPAAGHVQWAVVILTGLLVIAAYLRGPDPDQVYMAFRGSPIVLGMAAATLANLAVALSSGWPRYVSIVGSTYLVFVSASRSSILVFLAAFASLVVADLLHVNGMSEVRAILMRLTRGVGLLAICLVLIIAPTWAWAYYPFFSSRPGQIICPANPEWPCVEQRWLFYAQYRRWERLFRAVALRLKVPLEEWTTPVPPSLLPQVEGRIDLLKGSVQAIARRPGGWWPKSFEHVMPMECGVPDVSSYRCTYPHNLVLEIGFHFGWLPLLLVAGGMLVWWLHVIQSLHASSPPIVRIVGICFLAWLTFAMVSGSLIDHVPALVLGGIWLVASAAPARATDVGFAGLLNTWDDVHD